MGFNLRLSVLGGVQGGRRTFIRHVIYRFIITSYNIISDMYVTQANR